MGWAQSPPFFCAYTETIADIANTPMNLPATQHLLLLASQLPNHPQHSTFHPSAIVLGNSNTAPLSYIDVYIEDFITVAQPPHHRQTLNTLLHAIDNVFLDTPPSNHRAILSMKKLQQGDATLSTFKCILGWDVDTNRMTLQLSEHRLLKLIHLIQPLLGQK